MLKKLIQFSIKEESETLTCSELMSCVFNLNETDLRVFGAISKKNGSTISQLGHILHKDRSTIYRSLEKLIACTLCYRERKSGRTRGFVDYYHTISKDEAMKKAEQRLDTCYLKLKNILRENM